MTDPRALSWEYIRHPYSPGWLDPFMVMPGRPGGLRRRGNDSFTDLERFLRHLPLFLDEDKVRNAFGDKDASGTSMAVEKAAESDPNTFTCDFHVHGFQPGDIKVKTIGKKVVIDAEMEDNHEEEDIQSYSRRQFHRSIVLPDNVNVEALTSSLTDAGVLKLKAPLLSLPPPEETKEVPISVEKMEAVEES